MGHVIGGGLNGGNATELEKAGRVIGAFGWYQDKIVASAGYGPADRLYVQLGVEGKKIQPECWCLPVTRGGIKMTRRILEK